MLLCKLKLCFDLFQTILADALVVKVYDAIGIAAEYAAGLIFLQDNAVFVGKDLQGILFVNVHGLTDADGQYDSPQLIYLAYDTC
jgi:hypothetical protein